MATPSVAEATAKLLEAHKVWQDVENILPKGVPVTLTLEQRAKLAAFSDAIKDLRKAKNLPSGGRTRRHRRKHHKTRSTRALTARRHR